MSTHRYAHLYPPAAASLFQLHDDPYKHAQSHPLNYAMVWAMLHGTQPPGYMDAAMTQAQTSAHADGEAAHQQPHAVAVRPATPAAAATTVSLHVDGAATAATSTAIATAPVATPPTPAAVAAPAASAAPIPLAASTEPATHPGTYSRAQLLSLHRASPPLPPELEQVLHAAPAATPWLSSCVSADALQPLLLSSRPHPAEAELRAELRRDADLTGVEEYAHEWWLPSYSDMAKMGLATGGRHAGGRGGGRGKRGRGGGNRGGGRGGYQNNYNDKQHSNKKAQESAQSHYPQPPQPQQSTEPAASAVVAPTAAASSTAAVVAPSPAAIAPTLGAGRKGQKRPPVRTDADTQQQQQKRQYAQTNISRLFIGPTGAPLVSPSAPLMSMQFVLPSGSPPVKHETAPTSATTAALAPSPGPPAGVSAIPAASPLPSKEAVFQQTTAGGGSIADEIMRNIQMHKLMQSQKAAVGAPAAGVNGAATQ